MRLRNKRTGEIIETYEIMHNGQDKIVMKKKGEEFEIYPYEYNSLAELSAEWEDAPEEPKDFWFIDPEVLIACESTEPLLCDKKVAIETMKQIGNYFKTKEEAELAVRKLKAWKRLKDRNLRFNLNYSTGGATINHKDVIMCRIEAYFDDKWEEENMKAEEDLDLLLGGEE